VVSDQWSVISGQSQRVGEGTRKERGGNEPGTDEGCLRQEAAHNVGPDH
jgi:hypothetical protein